VLLSVTFCKYRVKHGHILPRKYCVTWGSGTYFFIENAELFSFFNGHDVFKTTDKSIIKPDIQIVQDISSTHRALQDTIYVRRDDLPLISPYLILMECFAFEIINVRIRAEASTTDFNDTPPAQTLFRKSSMTNMVKCKGYGELQWKFDYAK
jgi:uncharacterized membrane protein